MKKGECNRGGDEKKEKGKGKGKDGEKKTGVSRGFEKKIFTGKKSAEITYASKGDSDHPDRFFDMRRRHWQHHRGGRIPTDFDMQMRQKKRECQEYAEEFKKLQREGDDEPKTVLKMTSKKELEVSAEKRAKVTVAPPCHLVIKAKNGSSTEIASTRGKEQKEDAKEQRREKDKDEKKDEEKETGEKDVAPAFAGFGGYASSSEEDEEKEGSSSSSSE